MKNSDYLHKVRTLVRLLACGNGQEVHRRWKQFVNFQRVKKSSGKSFVYEDLGFPAVCHPEWRESLDWFLDGKSDTEETRMAATWLERGDSCIDLGANLGLYSFCFSHLVGTEGEVLAVDADQMIVQRLRSAALLLKAAQIHAERAAVSDRSGEISFFVDSNQSKTQEQSLVPPPGGQASFQAVRVPAFTFSEVVQRLRYPEKLSLVKIDIEGAEALALRSVPSHLLEADGPLWQMELNPEALSRFGQKPGDMATKFDPEKFEVWIFPQYPLSDDPQCGEPRQLTLSEDFQCAAFYNLVAIPLGARWNQRRERLLGILHGHE
jgi:FkbM family methyltransferase